MLRPHFLSADMGISGANFLVAETGTTLIVTNEGNGRMTTTLPRVHVAITGIEKVVPTLEDVATLLRLLPRSATGQIDLQLHFVHDRRRRGAGDSDGPEHFHIILVDAGRTRLIGSDMQAMLRCIRCGACMNHCPVYQNVGGHAYGWVYPGPMGSVLTPTYVGLENALDLPHASTLVQPVRRRVPGQDSAARSDAQAARETVRAAACARGRARRAQRCGPGRRGARALYAMWRHSASRVLKWMGGGDKLIHHLPFGARLDRGPRFAGAAGQNLS